MMRDYHVRFCERGRVKLPFPTRHKTVGHNIKMKNRLTILNIASGLLLIGVIGYTIFNYGELSKGEGWGVVAMIGLFIIACVGLIIDLIIQFSTKNIRPRKRFIIRNIIGLLILISAYYVERINSNDLTINVPNDYNDAVAVVYSVPNAPKLSKNILTLNSKIKMPTDGIILTKTNIRYNDIPYTHFIRENGTEISISGTWNNLYSDQIPINCNGKTVIVRISHLGTENGEKKINKKLKDVKEKLEKYCAQQR